MPEQDPNTTPPCTALAAQNLIRRMAAMTKDGEIVEGKPFDMSNDDAVDTLHSLISGAREIAMQTASDVTQTTPPPLTPEDAHGKSLDVLLPGAEYHVSCYADFYGEKNKKLQFLINDALNDDPMLMIRFNDDGTIHGVVYDRDYLRGKMRTESAEQDDWSIERDGKLPG